MISAAKSGAVHPLVYALLPDKRESAYALLFDMVKELDADFRPSLIHSDYELAIINSIRKKIL